MKNKTIRRKKEYNSEIISEASIIIFLKALGYKIVEYIDGRWEGYRYEEEWIEHVLLCAVKKGEKASPFGFKDTPTGNEITRVFEREFEKSLLKLLLGEHNFDENGNLIYLKNL